MVLASAGFAAPTANAAANAPARSIAEQDAQVASDGVRWRSRRFVYKAEGKRVSEVLTDFAASQGLPAVIGEGVDGVVQASFDNAPTQFLNAISKAYGLIWYFDGSALYFYPSRAIQSRLFRLKGYTGAQVENLLQSLQTVDKRYPLRYHRAENTLLVYGPPRHVELVSAAIEALDVGAGEGRRVVAKVVPLRYGWAADRHFGETTLPGVAAVLRGLYSGETARADAVGDGGAGGSSDVARKAATVTRMYGLDRGAPQLPTPNTGQESHAGRDRSITGNAPRGVRSPLDDDPADAPSFQADEGTNSVIVRGRQDRMEEYFDVIRRLDVRPTLVELEAVIIDVSNDSLDSLGIDWSAQGSHGGVSVTSPNSAPADGSVVNPRGFTINTLWSNAGRQLLARISALAANGKARVVAKPRVLGVANRTAVMKEKRIANVRVAGNLDTSLYQVEAGTDLQVTPQVMELSTASRIKLSLYIVDGKFEDVEVDQVPVIRRTEIRTEAYMTEGESLLIGGITSDADIVRKGGVPGLSKVPVLGALFRWDETKAAHSERLFLITPRLVRDAPASVPQSSAPAETSEPPRITPPTSPTTP